MTTYLGKSCSFRLPRVPFINCRQFMYLVIYFGFEGRIWDLIVSVPDHCLSFYFRLSSPPVSQQSFLTFPYFYTDCSKAVLLLCFLTVICSCCPYFYFGSAIMLVTYFVNFR